MIKIKEIYGYKLGYDESQKYFVVEDTNGTELAHDNTQDGAEVKAKALSKQEFKRISIVRVEGEGNVTLGECTSLNKDAEEAWVSMKKEKDGWGSGRQKISLRYNHGYYEATEANLKILENIRSKREALLQIISDINALKGTLEKPINNKYFGIIK